MASSLQNASKLGDLLAQLPLNTNQEQWDIIESTAQTLANELREKNLEQQSALGHTFLPQTLTSLLKGATESRAIPIEGKKRAAFEILRVGANLCRDHDQNRGALLEAGFPQKVVEILEGYSDLVDPQLNTALPLSLQDLRIIKTCIGVLINLCIRHADVKDTLVTLDAAEIMLELSIPIYPPGSWLHEKSDTETTELSEIEQAEITEAWDTRAGLASWAWILISELRDEDPKITPQLFTPDVLPLFARVFNHFVPPFFSPPPRFSSPSSQKNFIQADFQVLEEVCALLEALVMDDEEVRLALVTDFKTPLKSGGASCLSEMLNFIEHGTLPPYYGSSSDEAPDADYSAKATSFARCKAAVIKAVVEVAGEDKSMEILWDDTSEDKEKPGGEFVDRMVQWIRTHKTLGESNRDDLIICATLCLANLVRKESHSIAIAHPPISLAPDLAELLEPSTDFKAQHGIIGFLKHLAQAAPNRAILGKARVLQKLAVSGVWDTRADSIETLQVSSIGVAKHMCNGNVKNAFKLILPSSSTPPDKTAFKKILALVQRSDAVAVKSEGTRVLVNVIKSLWSADIPSTDETSRERRKAAMDIVANPASAAALAQLIGRSRKYPLLINEGVVALSLLSAHTGGGVLVLDSLLNPLPTEAHQGRPFHPPTSAGGLLGTPAGFEDSPVVHGPRRALDTLLYVLRGGSSGSSSITTSPSVPVVPVEVRANICGLIGHLGRRGVVSADRARDIEIMKNASKDLLEKLSADAGEPSKPIPSAARKALNAWSA